MSNKKWTPRPLDRSAAQQLAELLADDEVERRFAELEEEPDENGDFDDSKEREERKKLKKEYSLLAGVLCARGLDDPEEAIAFLNPETEISFGSPFALQDMDKACERIWRAVDNKETVYIFGDYDVDGITATTLLAEQLMEMGAVVRCKLPKRDSDGYGLNTAAVDEMHRNGCTLIVTVDNGVSAGKEIEYAASLGMDVVVTDHHVPPDTLPQAVAVVNPKRTDDTSGFQGFSGAGVAFLLCAALGGCSPEEMLEVCGDLATLGTVADVMPLTGQNRRLVAAGLRYLQQSERPGIRALLDAAGLNGKPFTAESISFALAPRINAAGRMESAASALKLMLSRSDAAAAEKAEELNRLNQMRQTLEQQIADAAQKQLEEHPDRAQDKIVLVWDKGWHQGVIGIVASRLTEKLGRPVMVISIDENGEGKGSGRSVAGFDLHDCISSCSSLLDRFGGHPMAAGLSVKEENIEALRKAMNEWAETNARNAQQPEILYDLAPRLDRITADAVQALDKLAPFGSENPKPVFLLENLWIEEVAAISEGRHTRLRVRQGITQFSAALFGKRPGEFPLQRGSLCEALMELSVFQGRNGPLLSGRIVDIRAAEIGENDTELQRELFSRLDRGLPVSAELAAALLPDRGLKEQVYKEVRARKNGAEEQSLLAYIGTEKTGKILVVLRAMEQAQLLKKTIAGGLTVWSAVPVTSKKNLEETPVLRRLAELQQNTQNRGEQQT